jgi:3',5'-cyclic AMP phosphodiesterase CpdA
MKIAHISDLHLNSFFRNSNIVAIKHLLKYALSKDFDHMVITGDLTDDAGDLDFRILRNLFQSLNLLRSERLSIIIGNHDIFGGIQTAEDIFLFPKRCSKADYHKKIKKFVDYFHESFENCAYISKNSFFPFAKFINGVLIVGLNSNAEYSRVKNPFASNGEISSEQLNETEFIFREFKDVRAKILLIHHHFNKIKTSGGKTAIGLWQNMEKQTMKLRKKKKLFNLLNLHEIDLVLHGHYHENREYYRKGIRFLNSGASVKNNNAGELQINFVEIKNGEIITEIHKLVSDMGIVIHRAVKENIQPAGVELNAAVNY